MFQFDPTLITPVDYSSTIKNILTIHHKKYELDLETYKKLMRYEADAMIYFVEAKNRKEKKTFEKLKIDKFDIWFIMKKTDLDNYYRSL